MIHDVAIIGSGISAGPVAERLAREGRGLRVIVIERGPAPWPDIRWRSRGGERMQPRWWTSPAPGGASRLWYGQVSRFTPADFETPTPWPVGPGAWRAHYDAVARILKPYCADHLLRGVAAPGDGLSTPRTALSTMERRMHAHLVDRGIDAWSGQTCLGGHGWSAGPVDPATLAPMALPAPHAHARNWLHRIETLCAAQPGFERVTGVTVTALRPGPGGCEILGRAGRGAPWSARARRVVVASGVTETVRLLSTLPDPSPTLGEGFTLTTEMTAYARTDLRRGGAADPRIGRFAHVSARFPFAAASDDSVGGGDGGASRGTGPTGKFSFYDAAAFETPERLRRKLAGLANAPQIDVSPDGPMILKISFKGRSEVSAAKRIHVDEEGRARLDYTPTEADRRLVAEAGQAALRLLDGLPGAELLAMTDNVSGDDFSSAHLHGGACFGTDPARSVLDPDCRVWRHPEVAVADGAFMPGSGATNSSLTVMANAWRVAGRLLGTL